MIRAAQRRPLFLAVAASLVLHTAFLSFFYSHPLIFSPALRSFFGWTSAPAELLEEEGFSSGQILQEVFERILFSAHRQRPFDLNELPEGMALAPDREGEGMGSWIQSPDFLADMSYASAQVPEVELGEAQEVLPLFSSAMEPNRVVSQLQIDALSSTAVLRVPVLRSEERDCVALSEVLLAAPEEGSLQVEWGEGMSLHTDAEPLSAVAFDTEKTASLLPPLFVPQAPAKARGQRMHLASSVMPFNPADLPPMATATAWNEDFEVDVVFLPNPDAEGYIFSITLSPSSEIADYSLRQNIYFVLDRSGSVPKHRFSSFKRAVVKALASIQPTDRFNILLVDKSITLFKKENCPASFRNIQAAEEFLEKQEAGGLFGSGEIYSSLGKCLRHIPDDAEMHTIVLLTDGQSKLNTERKQRALQKWVDANQGRVSLYAAAVGRDNDLVTLDLLSAISGGSLLYADTHASFPRKLGKLMLDLKNPVAKNIAIETRPQNSEAEIDFYPAGTHLPALFCNRPYVLYGKIDKPCEFDLVVQGRHRDRWIGIRKEISFYDGRKGDFDLASRFGAQLANLCYSKFLREGKNAHLKEAKEILKKTRTHISFE